MTFRVYWRIPTAAGPGDAQLRLGLGRFVGESGDIVGPANQGGCIILRVGNFADEKF
jgi:hypothetical protein